MYCCDAPKTPTHNTAYLAARVAMLRNTDPEVDEPSVLVSVAVVVVDPAGITRSTTASLVHSAVLRRNDAYTIGPEAMACGGVGALATDTWLPTGAVERWARTVIDGAVWCGTESQSSWRWSRSPSSTPSDVTWTATPQPTVLFHQSGLCFCQGANRWRVTATSDYNGYASRCADAARAAHPEYAKPVTSVVLVDFDDDAFSHASFFGGREYSSISHFAQVYGLPKYTSPGEEYRHTCSQSHDTLIGAARQPADDWLQVTSPSLLSRFIRLSSDETSQALSNMERAALTDAQCMHQLVAAMADQAVVAEYAHTPNPFTRRHLCSPAMQSFAKRTLSSPFRNTPSTAVGKCLRRSGDNDSDDTEWARQ